jgi:type IV secretory pathway TrbD component
MTREMAGVNRVVVYRARIRYLLLGTLLTIFGLFGVIAGLDDREWWIVIWGIAFAFMGVFSFRQAARRDPAIVIDTEGIESRIQRFRLGWNEVEEIRPYSRYAGRFYRQKWLLLRVHDLDNVIRQAPNRFVRAVGSLERKLGFRSAFIPLNMLSLHPREVLAAVRRFYDGPIRGDF